MNREIQQNGFSTLEMLIAMAILITALTAVMLVSFGNQSLLSDSQTSAEALSLAQGLLENEQALARQDFKLVVPTSTTVTLGPLTYTENVSVQTQPDYFTKNVKATITWSGDHNRVETTALSAVVTNFNNAVGGDTCDSVLTPSADAWKNPQIKNSVTSLASLANISGTYPINDLDAYQGRLYVAVGSTANKTDPTFFVFDTNKLINNLANSLIGSLDNNGSSVGTGGLAAVAVATSTSQNYAYVASAYGASFNTATGACSNNNGANLACGQLQVIDVSGPTPQVKYTFEMPVASGVVGSSGSAVGNSIFYSNGYVYLGLTKTSSGPEFNIIDVHNPLNPQWVGSYQVGYNINAIYVSNGYAYLAHPTDSSASNQEQVTVLDVSTPSSPKRIGDYHAPDNQGNGKSLDLVGNTLYLGRTVTTTNPPTYEFYILNDSSPSGLAANNPNSLQPPGAKISSTVEGVSVRFGLDSSKAFHTLAFLLTKTQFQVWDASNPLSVSAWGLPVNLPASGGLEEPSFDCEGNYFYVGSNDSGNNGYLSVISP